MVKKCNGQDIFLTGDVSSGAKGEGGSRGKGAAMRAWGGGSKMEGSPPRWRGDRARSPPRYNGGKGGGKFAGMHDDRGSRDYDDYAGKGFKGWGWGKGKGKYDDFMGMDGYSK